MLTTMRRARRMLFLLTAVIAVGWSTVVESNDGLRRDRIQVVAADDGVTTQQIIQDLRKRLPFAQFATEPAQLKSGCKDCIYITLGPTALRSLLAQRPEGTVISAYTSSQAYRSILDSAPEHRAAHVTAIYAEPSPVIQMRLISMLYKRPVPTAVILSTKATALEPSLQRAAAQFRIPLTVQYFSAGDNLNRLLNRLVEVPVILAIPDANIYNAESFRNILVTTYRSNQAVVGFSAALVHAGALATTYSNVEDIDAQIVELVSDLESSGKLPEPQFPKYFSTIVNEEVAWSLNIVIDAAVRNFARKPGQKVRQQ